MRNSSQFCGWIVFRERPQTRGAAYAFGVRVAVVFCNYPKNQIIIFSPSPNVAKVVYVKQNMLFKKNMKENNSLSEDEIPIYPLSLFLPEVKGALQQIYCHSRHSIKLVHYTSEGACEDHQILLWLRPERTPLVSILFINPFLSKIDFKEMRKSPNEK